MSRPTFTAKLLSDMARQTNDAKLVTVWSMASGAVGTINYQGNLYEVRVTPVQYGIEKWSHPKTKSSKPTRHEKMERLVKRLDRLRWAGKLKEAEAVRQKLTKLLEAA